jgi:TetR/AcrR family transcriptional repressor of nem operon
MKTKEKKQPEARRKLIEATTSLILKQGFNATTLDEICAKAGVAKGSFFYHFENKDDIGQAVAKAWGEFGQAMYAKAWKKPGEPLEEIHRLFDVIDSITRRPEPCVCLVGMLTQELSGEHSRFREACAHELGIWTEMFSARLQAAKEKLKPDLDFDPAEVAWFLNSIWQGSMLVGKACQSPEMIRTNLKLARNYVDSLFAKSQKPGSQ